MPRVSIILPTNRVGGLDITFETLAQQSLPDFELILVDHLYPWRKDIVAQEASRYSFAFKHVQPFNDPFPEQAYQRCLNSGLIHASGDVALVVCDYTSFPSDLVEKHSLFHAETRRPRALLGTMQLATTPQIATDFPLGRHGAGTIEEHRRVWANSVTRTAAIKKWCENYMADLTVGSLAPFMWSVFQKPWMNDQLPNLDIFHKEPKMSFPEGLVDPFACNLKNDSFPLQKLIDLNGFDEDFDRGHTYQDTEIAKRLTYLGVEFHIRPQINVTVIDAHHLVTIRKIERPEIANQAVYYSKHEIPSPVVRANPTLNLKKMRQEIA